MRTKRRPQALAITSALLAASIGAAEAVTCKDFSQALWNAVLDAGDKVAQPNMDKVAYRRSDGTYVRYEMQGIVGLKGNLDCVQPDQLDRFDAMTVSSPKKEEQELRIARLIALGAAAICAVRTKPQPKPEACHKLSMTLAYAAIKAWDAERIRGEEVPIRVQWSRTERWVYSRIRR